MKKNIVIALYGFPENYPPTLNAVSQLAKMFDEVTILYRPLFPVRWDYPSNVRLHPSGEEMTVKAQEQASPLKKLRLLYRFVLDLTKLCRQKKPTVVLLYDQLALAAYSYARRISPGKPLVWYHNHDILEGGNWRILSPSWIAVRQEPKMFPHLDIFTLPTEDRKAYFPMDRLKGKYFLLPNMPSIAFYEPFFQNKNESNGSLRLIYQGHMGIGHGLEDIISLLPYSVKSKPVNVVLVGWLRKDFEEKLTPLLQRTGVRDLVELKGYTPYKVLPGITNTCQIGLAIYTRTDITNSTLGTASNKIFEYAALGLPVLYYDNEHFRKHLGNYSWAVPTKTSGEALKKSLEYIAGNYEELSRQARQDFLSTLNFEYRFEPVRQFIEKHLP